MTILAGDIKLTKSQVMDDVPEGGGAPTSEIIQNNVSNEVFNDISESDRAGGRINLRKVNVSVQTDNRDTYLGANVIVAEPPNDPNVAVTIFKANTPFDRRTDAENQLEAYSIRGPLWSGYLLENHVINMRSIQILQRPGTALPNINRTLCLVYDEGLPTEREQYVRVTRVESEERVYTDTSSGTAVDFRAEVVTCSISDRLRQNFPGSPPSRTFAPLANRTIVRDTTVADAGSYSGVAPLALAADIGDSALLAESIYTQLVPSSRTESIAVDQRPAAQRQITLASAPRLVQVASAPHTMRIKIGQENRGYAFTQILKPFPAAGTVVVSFRALGNWYTVVDDGLGGLTGSGVGTVNYANGSIAVTLDAMPDVGSTVIFQWGEKAGFTNRSGQAGFRAPEFAYQLANGGLVPSSLAISWESGGVLRNATDDGKGAISGAATGEINYATGEMFLRPNYLIDAGGTFQITYDKSNRVTKTVTPSVDEAGFAVITLDTVPVPNSVALRWITVRNVSTSSGGSSAGTSANKTVGTKTTTINVPAPPGSVSTRLPVSMSRVALGLGDLAVNKLVPYMHPAGRRAANGQAMFVALNPLLDEQGYYYSAPDFSAVEWTELEVSAHQIVVGGVTYKQWGYHNLPSGQVSAAG